MKVKDQEISLDMTMQEVRSLLGDPDDISMKPKKDNRIRTWKYLAEDQNYQIFFYKEKVYDISLRDNETGNRIEFETEEGRFTRQ